MHPKRMGSEGDMDLPQICPLSATCARSPLLTPIARWHYQSRMTTNLSHLTTGQLNRIIAIKEKIESLQSRIDTITADGDRALSPTTDAAPKKRRSRMSRAGRARIAAAQRARWAKVKRNGNVALGTARKKDRRSSPAVRAKLAAAARARWAKVRAAGMKTL